MSLPINEKEINEVLRLVSVDPQAALDEANRLLDRSAHRKDTSYVLLHNLMAGSALRLHREELADRYIRDGLAVDDNPHLYNTRAAIYRQMGRLDEALEAVNHAILLQGDTAEFYRTKAVLLFSLERFDELREMFNNILTTPGFQRLRRQYEGGMAWREGDYVGGEQNLEAAIAMDPRQPDAYFDLAMMFKAQGKHDKVIESLERHGTVTSQGEIALAELATAYLRQGNKPAAMEKATAALNLNRFNLLAATTKANIQMSNGDHGSARKTLEQLTVEGVPAVLQSQIYGQLGQIEESEENFDKAFNHYRAARSSQKTALDNLPALSEASQALLRDARRPANEDILSDIDLITFVISLPGEETAILPRLLETHKDIDVISEDETIDRLLSDDNYIQELLANAHGQPKQLVCISPYLLLKLPTIQARFPNAKLLHLTRHPKDVCLGCFSSEHEINALTVPFLEWLPTVDWITQLQEVWFIHEANRNNPVLQVGFERLATEPADTIESICGFIGISHFELTVDQAKDCTQHQKDIGRWLAFSSDSAPFSNELSSICARLGYLNY